MVAKKYGWDNYLIIENEFIEAKKYLSFERQVNFETDSPFFHNEIVLLGSLVEIAIKKLIEFENPDNKFAPNKISDYRRLLLFLFPDIEKYHSTLIYSDIILKPFEGWSKNRLKWWEAYSSIKHGSSRLPKLEHALNLLSAYEIILHLIHFEEAKLAGDKYIFYQFTEMPRLLDFGFRSLVSSTGIIGYGFNADQYKICDDKTCLQQLIDIIKEERSEKNGSDNKVHT